MKGYSTLPKAPALLEPHHQIVQCHILDTRCEGGILPLCREAVGVFYSPGRMVKELLFFHLSLLRGKTPTNEYPRYDTKQSDGEVPVMLEL